MCRATLATVSHLRPEENPTRMFKVCDTRRVTINRPGHACSIAAVQRAYEAEQQKQPDDDFDWYSDEEEEDDCGPNAAVVLAKHQDVTDDLEEDAGCSFYGLSSSVGAAVNSTSAAMSTAVSQGYRADLDKEYQERQVKDYYAEKRELWLQAQDKFKANMGISTWNKHHQALALTFLCAEAHLFQRRKLAAGAATRKVMNAPRVPGQLPKTKDLCKLKLSDRRIFEMLAYDIKVLVNNKQGMDRLAGVKTELTQMDMWN